MQKNIVESTAKCPKCKNMKQLCLTEVWQGSTISWNVVNGKFDRNDGSLEPGHPYKVEAKCPCGYGWTIRKALQIDYVIK